MGKKFYTISQGTVRVETMMSVDRYRKDYEWVDWEFVFGGMGVNIGRDVAVAKFLETDFDHLIFIDHDMVFKSSDVDRLLGDTVIGGLYGMEPGRFAMSYVGKSLHIDGEMHEARGVGMGFTAIPRRIFEKIIDKLGEPLQKSEFEQATEKDGDTFTRKQRTLQAYPFFQDIKKGGYYWGEDMSFCERVIAAGEKVYLHTGVQCGHMKTRMLDVAGTLDKKLKTEYYSWDYLDKVQAILGDDAS
jgi:hypothetical protein